MQTGSIVSNDVCLQMGASVKVRSVAVWNASKVVQVVLCGEYGIRLRS